MPSCRATRPYDAVSPYPMVSSCSHTRCWKAVPRGASGRSNSFRSRAKYAVSWSTALRSNGLSSARSPIGSPLGEPTNGLNSMAAIIPPRAPTRRSSIGDPVTVHIVVVISPALVVVTLCLRPCVECPCVDVFSMFEPHVVEHDGPQPHQRVGAPWPPALAASSHVLDVQPCRRVAHPDVGREEHVRVAECPHRDVVSRPGADPRQGQQRCPGLGAVGAAVEPHLTPVQGGGQADERPRT